LFDVFCLMNWKRCK